MLQTVLRARQILPALVLMAVAANTQLSTVFGGVVAVSNLADTTNGTDAAY